MNLKIKDMFKKKKDMQKLKLELKQKKVERLLDKMLASNIEVHNAPLSNEYFILDRQKEVYVIVGYSSIKICNHMYRYEIPISGAECDKYIKKINKKLQSHSESIKKELFQNEISLLDNINELYASEVEAEELLQEKNYKELMEENDIAMEQLISAENGGIN